MRSICQKCLTSVSSMRRLNRPRYKDMLIEQILTPNTSIPSSTPSSITIMKERHSSNQDRKANQRWRKKARKNPNGDRVRNYRSWRRVPNRHRKTSEAKLQAPRKKEEETKIKSWATKETIRVLNRLILELQNASGDVSVDEAMPGRKINSCVRRTYLRNYQIRTVKITYSR